jgi:hypothetical protein
VIRLRGADSFTQQVSPVQGDGAGEYRNGYPIGIYLPRDPGRRRRLLRLLGYLPGNTEDDRDVRHERR